MSAIDARILKEKAEKEYKERRRKKPPTEGRIDVEPAIDPSHLDTLEREQQREQLAKIQPKDKSPTTKAVQVAFEAEKQAQQVEQLIAEEAAIYQQNIQQAQEQIDMLSESPSQYTIDGRQVKGEDIDRLKRDLEQYKQDYSKWVQDTSAQSVLLREKSKEILGEVSSWSQRVVERNRVVAQQKQDYNRRLQENIGFGSSLTREPEISEQPYITPFGAFNIALNRVGELPLTQALYRGGAVIEKQATKITNPIRDLGESMIEKAVRQPSLIATSAYLTGVGLETVAGAIDVATFGYRPGLQLETVKALGYLATDSDTRKQFAETIKRDPFRFAAVTVGSAALGGQLSSFTNKLYTERGPVYRTLKAGGTPKQALAVMGRKTARVDFNQLLKEEMAYRYPEEAIQPEFLETFTPKSTYELDATFNKKFGKINEALTEGEFRIKPTTGTYPRSGYLGFGRTGADLLPMIIPEEYAIPSTVWKYSRNLLNIPSGAPGIPFTEMVQRITQPTISFSDIFKSTALQVKPVTATKQKTPTVQKPRTLEQNMQMFNQKLKTDYKATIGSIPNISSITGISQIQPQIQRQKTTQIQSPVITPIQTPTPDFEEKLSTFFTLPPQTRPKRPTPIDLRKKKKKKTKTLGNTDKILEFRIDPLKTITIGGRKK